MTTARVPISLALALAAQSTSAEVVDKLASISQLWVTAAVMGFALAVIGLFAPRSWIGAALVVALCLMMTWPPAVEPEFLSEAILHFGAAYESHARVSRLLVPLIGVGGLCGRILASSQTQRQLTSVRSPLR